MVLSRREIRFLKWTAVATGNLLLCSYLYSVVYPRSEEWSYICNGPDCVPCTLQTIQQDQRTPCAATTSASGASSLLENGPNSVCGYVAQDWEIIEAYFTSTSLESGKWSPPSSPSSEQVAIVIPYRNREAHLKTLLVRLHTLLQRQQIPYQMFVIEQIDDGTPFNRGMVKNIGFAEATKLSEAFGCVYFHDVDLLPELDSNIYDCPRVPRHHSITLNIWRYQRCYSALIGGVIALPIEHMRAINGFSNYYFSWGSEDDDMYQRLVRSNIPIEKISPSLGRYTMLAHEKDNPNPSRLHMLFDADAESQRNDGLSSLKYTLHRTELHRYEKEGELERDGDWQKLKWNMRFGYLKDPTFLWSKLTSRC